MLTFKSMQDIERARLPLPIKNLIRRFFGYFMREIEKVGGGYDPEADGYYAYLKPEEALEDLLREVSPKGILSDIILENVSYYAKERCFTLSWIPNNSFGITFVVPDAIGLHPELRKWLMAQVEPVED